jgi:hypothetical protein
MAAFRSFAEGIGLPDSILATIHHDDLWRVTGRVLLSD